MKEDKDLTQDAKPFGRIERIKNHLIENKEVYTIVGVGVACVGVGVLIAPKQIVINDITIGLKWKSSHTSQTALTKGGQPGFMVQCIETGEPFRSQALAAQTKGINESELSQHLRGKRENAGGFHFKRVGKAVV